MISIVIVLRRDFLSHIIQPEMAKVTVSALFCVSTVPLTLAALDLKALKV